MKQLTTNHTDYAKVLGHGTEGTMMKRITLGMGTALLTASVAFAASAAVDNYRQSPPTARDAVRQPSISAAWTSDTDSFTAPRGFDLAMVSRRSTAWPSEEGGPVGRARGRVNRRRVA